MSSRNIFKFRQQFSGLSVKIYFCRKKKSDIELLKETENFNMLVLDSLFRERSGPYESSSHSLKPEFPQQV